MENLTHLVDATLAVEKLRVASQVRQAHLGRNGRQDLDTDELVNRLVNLESWIDGRVAVIIKDHPAYPWFSRVKGVGKENIGKVVAQMRVKPGKGWKKAKDPETGELILLEADLPYADTISALWKFAGFAVAENGHAPKRVTGVKLSYNSQLRSMCWRLGGSLMKANGKFKSFYDGAKKEYVARYQAQGIAIVPAAQLPKVEGKKVEGTTHISEGHVHNQALRKMIKLFLACLWLAWRKAEGLPQTEPYAFQVQGHDQSHLIIPEEMTDR